MKAQTTVLLTTLLTLSFGFQPSTNSGLTIENGFRRGITYTDSLGIEYNLRYIPITITNDQTEPVRLQITFADTYNYPDTHLDERFRLVPLPMEWALDGVGVNKKMMAELPGYMNNPTVSKTLKPGEKWVMSIGALYLRETQHSGVIPEALSVMDQMDRDCPLVGASDDTIEPNHLLSLKLNFGGSCGMVLAGQFLHNE